MGDADLYKKYPHIIAGSIEKADVGHIIKGGKGNAFKSHGKICVIKCDAKLPGCVRTRIINIQDARQVKYCVECTKNKRNIRRNLRRRQKK